MLDCMKKYKMVLTDEDGNVYKSDNVDISGSRGYNIEKDGQMTADMHLIAWGFRQESVAETPPEMPTATVAAKATKIIQEEKRDKGIAEEWKKLTREICEAVRQGKEEITVEAIYIANKERLMKMGYEVNRDSCNYVFRIRWVEPEFKV